MDADIAAINRGEAIRHGQTYIVNDRIYGLDPSGVAYPISGPGIHVLDRGAFKALGVYNRFGESARAEEILDAMGVQAASRAAALTAWRSERGT
jgi:hypothetical protein